MPILSIIIPIYNTEPYLKRCIDSILNQTLKDIEVICINDDSPDNSMNILKEYDDARIKIIDFSKGYKNIKGNQGVSIARNEGIKIASGEYIGFVDSDDWIDMNFYEELYKKAKENEYDIVKGGVKILNLQGEESLFLEVNEKIKKDKYNFFSMMWSAIYKTSFIRENNIFFDTELKSGQVGVFLIETLKHTDKIEIINNVFYHYIRTEDSLISPYLNKEKIISRLSAIEKMLKITDNKTLFDNAKCSIVKYFYKNTAFETKMMVVKKMIELNFYTNITPDKLYKILQSKEINVDFPTKIIKLFNKIPLLKIQDDKIYLFSKFNILSIKYS
jgi:glycosyltransferase involved in cell wall biosynthesis